MQVGEMSPPPLVTTVEIQQSIYGAIAGELDLRRV